MLTNIGESLFERVTYGTTVGLLERMLLHGAAAPARLTPYGCRGSAAPRR